MSHLQTTWQHCTVGCKSSRSCQDRWTRCILHQKDMQHQQEQSGSSGSHDLSGWSLRHLSRPLISSLILWAHVCNYGRPARTTYLAEAVFQRGQQSPSHWAHPVTQHQSNCRHRCGRRGACTCSRRVSAQDTTHSTSWRCRAHHGGCSTHTHFLPCCR
jgi:hypothetical protein